MQSQPLVLRWTRFLFGRDKIGQALLAISIIAIAIWLLAVRDSMTFGLVSLGLLIFALVFSFLNYVTVGRYRETAEERFYDAIYSNCDFRSSFNGREMKKIKVQWSGLRVNRVIVHAATNSNAAKSGKEWRSLKLAVSDSFKLAGKQVVAILENQAKGHLEFVVVTDQQIAPGGEYSSAAFAENFMSFIYENFSSYGTPLPRLRHFEIDENGHSKPKLKSFDIVLHGTPSSYDRSTFAKNLKARYESSAKVWIINWTEDGVNVEAIKKGSEKEKRVLAEQSVIDLVSSSVTASFSWYGDHHVLNSKMIQWSSDGIPESITVDFLQNDVSREYQVEKFENHVRQGLSQLFKGIKYQFEWNVSAVDKMLTIRAT